MSSLFSKIFEVFLHFLFTFKKPQDICSAPQKTTLNIEAARQVFLPRDKILQKNFQKTALFFRIVFQNALQPCGKPRNALNLGRDDDLGRLTVRRLGKRLKAL